MAAKHKKKTRIKVKYMYIRKRFVGKKTKNNIMTFRNDYGHNHNAQ